MRAKLITIEQLLLCAGGDVMRKRSLLSMVAAALLLGGCTILHSSVDATDSAIPYYLPKTIILAEVKISRKGAKLDAEGKPLPPFKYYLEFDTAAAPANAPAKTRGDVVPDLNHRFFLTYNNNPFYNDRYCITTDANNLLSSIEYATEDATPRIALALTELARRGPQAFAPAAEPQIQPYTTVRVAFNPYDWRESAAAEAAIMHALPSENDIGRVKFHFPGLLRFKGEPTVTCRGDKGVCFRTKIRVPMLLTDGSASNRTGGRALTQTVMVDVVNVHHTGNFDLDRTFMVEKVVRLGFEQGALTQVIMRKPSEALETVKLPLAIADAILAVPADFVAKAGGDSVELKKALEAQRSAIDAIEKRLMTGLDATGAYNVAPYQEKCVGRANK